MAVVLADDEHAAPLLAGARRRAPAAVDLPARSPARPGVPRLRRGRRACSPRSSPRSSRRRATIAIDEWTHALRRNDFLFGDGPPVDGGTDHQRGQGRQDAGRAVAACARAADHRARHRRRPGAPRAGRTPDRSDRARSCARSSTTAPTPTSSTRSGRSCPPVDERTGRGRRPATSPARCCRPSASSSRATCCGSTPGSATHGFHSDFGRTWIVGREPDARQRGAVRAVERDHRDCGPRRHPRRRDRRPT